MELSKLPSCQNVILSLKSSIRGVKRQLKNKFIKNKYIYKIKKCQCIGKLVSMQISRSNCRHCSLLSVRRASMSAGWRSVPPMRRRSEHKVVGRDVRGRPLNVAATVSAKWWSIALFGRGHLSANASRDRITAILLL